MNQKINKNNAKYYIGKRVDVVIDRPINSRHPSYEDMIYKLNYGYIPGTIGGDGEEIDIYILDEEKPIKNCTAKVIAVIHRFDDNEDKLVGVVGEKNFSDDEIRERTNFVEKYYKSIIER